MHVDCKVFNIMKPKQQLDEDRKFRNKLILITILLLIMSFFAPKLLGFAIVFIFISIWNIMSYKKNVKEYNKLTNNEK